MNFRSAAPWLLVVAAACARPGLDRALGAAPGAVSWPAPPAAPRATLESVLSRETTSPPARPWWRVALGWVTGVEPSEAAAAGLARPFGVVLAEGATATIADPDSASVFRATVGGTLSPITCDRRPWSAPMGVAFGPDGALFVADAGAGVVIRVATDGCRELGAGRFERPTGLALVGDRVWVADPPAHAVLALDVAGEIVARVGQPGSGDGQFHFPTAVSAAPDGSLYVVDSLNFRVAHLGPDGSWLGAFGGPGLEGAGFARPKGVAVSRSGEVFVSDAQRDVVLAFSPAGDFQYSIGETGAAPGQFSHPAGLSVLGDRLAVADSQNQRVQVFKLVEVPK